MNITLLETKYPTMASSLITGRGFVIEFFKTLMSYYFSVFLST